MIASGRHRSWRRDSRIAVAAATLALLLVGCSASRTRFVPPDELPFTALDATREALLEKLRSDSGRIQTIRASVNYLASGDLRGESGELSERTYDSVRGGLAVDRPSLIRMNANTTLGLVQAFDMSSDGQEFRLSVPPQGKFYWGPNDGQIEGAGKNPLLTLRPHHVLQSLFVDVRPYLENTRVVQSFAEVSEGRRRFYVFSFIDASGQEGRLLERIWIDRRNLEVGRKQMFSENGAVELQVDYDFYEEIDGIVFPRVVAIDRPVEGASLRIEFLDTELNAELDAALFQLPYPQGAESIRVGEPLEAGGSSFGAAGSSAGPAAN